VDDLFGSQSQMGTGPARSILELGCDAATDGLMAMSQDAHQRAEWIAHKESFFKMNSSQPSLADMRAK
jgi:hypothetical protein